MLPRIATTVLLACSLAACTSRPPFAAAQSSSSTGSPSGTVTISIVGTNDLHGGVLQREDRGGLALLGGYVANLRAARAKDGGAVLLIDAGDMWQGTLESNLNEGAVVTAAYDALGYTAAAIGNHDFDFGPVGPDSTPKRPGDDPRGALKARAASASFPFLAANIIDTPTGKPVAWKNVRPSTVVTAAGVKLGIIGVITAEALQVTMAANTPGLRIAPLAETIAAEATRLRAGGASVVVVASHAGGVCSDLASPTDLSSCNLSEEIARVIAALPPGLVDVVIAGHRHLAMAHQIDGVAVSEAYTGGRAFGRVDLFLDRATHRVLERRSFPPRELCARVDPGTDRCDPGGASAARVQAQYEGAPVGPDPAVAKIVAAAVAAAAAQKAVPIGITLAAPLRRTQALDSAIGNLVTDAYLAAVPGADLAVNNTQGGLRADMPAGPITYGMVFEVMPFDNRVVAVHLTGAELRRAAAIWLGAGTPALPGIAGLRVQATCQHGTLQVALLRPDDSAVADADRLVVATTDFLATNGDNIFTPVAPTGLTVDRDVGAARDLVVDALRNRGGTLREADLLERGRSRWTLPGPRPITCR
jgi:5'-nucleotidase